MISFQGGGGHVVRQQRQVRVDILRRDNTGGEVCRSVTGILNARDTSRGGTR